MKIAFAADPLSGFKIAKDSTYAMMQEAAARGHELYAFGHRDMIFDGQRVMATVSRIALTGQSGLWYQVEDTALRPLTDFDAVIERTDPPFDMHYVTATWLLERAEADGARIWNRPGAIRSHNEKLAITGFPQFIAPTLVTSEAAHVRAFHAEHRDIILKPLDGMGGAGIFRVTDDGMNLGAIVETLTDDGRRTIMVQRYIPEIVHGDRRVLLIGGEVVPKVIQMSSGPKIDALVEKFGLSGETRPVESPMSKSFLPTAQGGNIHEGGGAGTPLEPGNRYCELVGSLLYLANTTRPDIAQAVGVLSRYRGTPTSAHMQEGLRLVRYLKGTRDYALQLGGSHVPIEGFVDADYAGDLDTRASTTGFVFKVYGGAVVWGSKKQTATATSTVEAEFRAASHAVKEAQWLRGLLEELQFDIWKIPLFCDNTGCIQNLKNPVNSKYTKHVAVSFHHARLAVVQGQVDIKYIATQANVADIFTKPLVPMLFKQHRDTLGVIERIVSAQVQGEVL